MYRCASDGRRRWEPLRNAYSGRVRRRLTERGESWSRQSRVAVAGAGGRVCRRVAAAAY